MIVKCNRCGLEALTPIDAQKLFIRYSEYTNGNRYRPLCKACKKATIPPTRKKDLPGYAEQERAANRTKRALYYTQNVQHIKDYLGGKIECSICGYTSNCFAPFDFHHIDPATKEFGIHKRIDSSPFIRWKTELDKCVLVCSNCHRKIHSTRCIDATIK